MKYKYFKFQAEGLEEVNILVSILEPRIFQLAFRREPEIQTSNDPKDDPFFFPGKLEVMIGVIDVEKAEIMDYFKNLPCFSTLAVETLRIADGPSPKSREK